MKKTIAELQADQETAYRVYELGRRINDPPRLIAIYQARLSACHDALAEAGRR